MKPLGISPFVSSRHPPPTQSTISGSLNQIQFTTMKKTFVVVSGILLAILLLVSCGDNPSPFEPEINEPNLRALTADEQTVVSSSNAFAFELLSRVNAANEEKNVFISPFSVSTALSMTLNGADGPTQDSMQLVLGLEHLEPAQINAAYKDLVTLIYSQDKKVVTEVANSNWYKQEYTINEAFEQLLLDYYEAEVKSADFSDPATVDLINDWIAVKTHDKITDMLDEIPADAVMYLINAIYFKADWTYQFDKSKTADADFTLSDGSIVNVPMMYSKGVNVGFAITEKYQLVDIPYGNGSFSFTVISEGWNNDQPVNDMVANFTSEDLSSLLSDTLHTTLELYMPRFKIEFKDLLNDPLMDMGMEIAFGSQADFSNLFEEDLNLAISRVIHQSFLEVNEEGSEAAAATIVEIVETSAGPPTRITLDKPFLFFIRENHTNTILFSGKLLNPTL